jgi:hypothetical protein
MTMGYLLLVQKLKLGVKMVEFSNGVSCSGDTLDVGTKDVLSADRLLPLPRSGRGEL